MFKKFILASSVFLSMVSISNASTLFFDDFNSNGLGTPAVPAGWNVTSGSVDVIGSPNFYEWYGPGRYIDMNGTSNPGQAGSMQTIETFNIFAGQSYLLSFDFGNNKYSQNNESLSFGLIGADLYAGGFTLTGLIPTLLQYSIVFTAIADDTVSIFFADSGETPGDNGGPIIDNVKLSAVPLPAALPLLAAGLGALGFASRRRRNKTAA